MFVIKNDFLKLVVNPLGAEMHSVRHLPSGQELLWQGDPAWWNRRAPNLFPVVGTLKGGMVELGGRECRIRKHGFARDLAWTEVNESSDSLRFSLCDTEETRKEYPFGFQAEIDYRLEGERLLVGFFLRSDEDLWFSWGGHPAFRCPLFEGETFGDYRVEFGAPEKGGVWRIDSAGLMKTAPEAFPGQGQTLPLDAKLFETDVMMWRDMASQEITLANRDDSYRLVMGFPGFPHLGIWTKPGAPFLCLEPWLGLPDPVDATGRGGDKPGLVHLEAGKLFSARYWMEFRVRPPRA